MRRWSGWGEESIMVKLPDSVRGFLIELVGQGVRLPDASLEVALTRIPASHLEVDPRHSINPREYLPRTREQSLPSWLTMCESDFGVYSDVAVYPEITK